MKKNALRIIYESSELYSKNLLNRNLLFVGKNFSNNNYSFTEVTFKRESFLHLTGVVIDKNRLSAKRFFKKSLDKRLRTVEFNFKPDGTTRLKLSILKDMMNVHINARILSDYDGSKMFLYTEKLAGNTDGCMGFRQDSNNNMKPDTLLKENIKKISKNETTVVLILRKPIEEKIYREITYKLGEFNHEEVLKALEIQYEEHKLDIDPKEIEQDVKESVLTK